MSLEELKRINAENEAKEAEEAPTPEAEEVLEEAAEVEVEEEVETDGEVETEAETDEPVEAWMQSDDQTSQDSDAVPLEAHVKLRHKLKAKVEERDDEIAELRAKIERMESAPAAAPEPTLTGKPKRDDFYDADDPDEAYFEAMFKWRSEQESQASQQAAAKQQQEQAMRDMDEKVQAHYQRVEKLLADNNLSPDLYKSADKNLRSAIESVRPGQGDVTTDYLISQIGEGSEKLVMFVGNTEARRNKFQAALASDPSGLSAMRLVGQWEAEIKQPQKKVSRAAKPSTNINGETGGNVSAEAKKLKRRYDEGYKGGNIQKAFDAKQQARKAGIDVSNW